MGWADAPLVEDESKTPAWASAPLVEEGVSTQASTPAEESSALRRYVADPAISLAKGVIGVPEAVTGLADIATLGRVGKALEGPGFRPKEAKAYLDSLLTQEQQEANKRVDQAEGFVDTAAAAIQNPSTIGHAIVEAIPGMLGGGAVARGLMKAAPAVSPLIAGAAGEGAVSAGSTAEQMRQATKDGLLTPTQAALAAGSGMATGALGVAGGKVAAKLGLADVDTLLAGGANTAAKAGIIRRVTGGALAEGVFEELPQSIQEQIAQNVALGKPWDEGVDKAAAMGMLVGGAMGGGANVRQGSVTAPGAPAAAPVDAGEVLGSPTAPAPPAAAPAPEPGIPFTPPSAVELAAMRAENLTSAPGVAPAPVGNEIAFEGLDPAARAVAIEQAQAAETARQQDLATRIDSQPINLAQEKAATMELAPSPAPLVGNEIDIRPFLEERALLKAAGLSVEQRLGEGDILGRPFEPAVITTLSQVDQLAEVNPAAAAEIHALINDYKPPKESANAKPAETRASAPDAQAARDGEKAAAVPGPAKAGAGEAQGVPAEAVKQAAVAPAAPQSEATAAPEARPSDPRAGATLDESAARAAPEPSKAQIEANNAKLGHDEVAGVPIAIENPAGSTRRDIHHEPPRWTTKMVAHYGRAKRTEGADGEPADVFVKPGTPRDYNGPVFVIDQFKAGGKGFDETKSMAGWATQAEAKSAYAAHYPKGWKVGPITEMTSAQWKAWTQSPYTKRAVKSLATSEWKKIEAAVPRAPEQVSRLQQVEREIGWAEVGGRMIREADTGGEKPEVVGRTSWVPKSNFWPERPTPKAITQAVARAALRKVAAGQRLSTSEQRFIDYAEKWLGEQDAATRVAEAEAGAAPIMPDPEDVAAAGLTEADAADGVLVKRAIEIDEGRVEALALQFENDDAGFLAAVKEIIDGQNQNDEAAAPRQADEEARGAEETTDREAALARVAQAAAAIRGAKPAEVGALIPQMDAARNAAEKAGATAVQIIQAMEAARRPMGPEKLAEALERERPKETAKPTETPAPAGVSTLDLKGETESEIRTREAREVKAAEAKKKRETAPEPQDFTLTGSDRQVDLARAKGQSELLEPVATYGNVQAFALPAAQGRGGFSLKSPTGQLDLFATGPVQGLPAGARAVFATEVAPAKKGEVRLGFERITSPAQAAHAFAALRKLPREYFAALVLDKAQKPIAYLDLYRGAIGQTTVYPAAFAMTIFQTPGAASVWMAHNHPGGMVEPSEADQRLTGLLKSHLEDTGIKYAGHVIIAGQQFADLDGAPGNIPPAARAYTVPIMERTIKRAGRLSEAAITSPSTARAMVEQLAKGEEGLVVLDIQNRPVAFLPMDIESAATLRTNDKDTGYGKLLQGIARANGAAVMAYSPRVLDGSESQIAFKYALNNLDRALRGLDVKFLDVITKDARTRAERGAMPYGDGPFFRRGSEEQPGLTPAQFKAAVAKTFGARVTEKLLDGVISPVATQEDLPEHLGKYVRDGDVIYGVHDPRTDRVYAVLENLSPGMVRGLTMHEVGVHYGFEAMLGEKLYGEVMERLETLIERGDKDVRKARESAERESANPSQVPEETLAYLVQSRPDLPLIQRVISAIKAFLFREFGIGKDWLNADDMAILARAAVQHAAASMDVPSVSTEAQPAWHKSSAAPIFYSEFARQVEAIKTESAPAAQWVGTLKGMKGVKADELEWSGVLDWLATKEGKVSKWEIAQYLDQNGVKVEEVMLGGDTSATSEFDSLKVELDAMGFDLGFFHDENTGNQVVSSITERRTKNQWEFVPGEGFFPMGDNEAAMPDRVQEIGERFAELEQEMGTEEYAPPGETKFSQYTLPGGKGYRELLLTLPVAREPFLILETPDQAEATRIAKAQGGYTEQRLGSDMIRVLKDNPAPAFNSSHFDTPNILAHVRFDERTAADGKRVLFIEEIQSDWAQKGKREGFAQDFEKSLTPEERELRDLNARTWEDAGGDLQRLSDESVRRAELQRRVGVSLQEKANRSRGIPVAPFVGKTEAWVALAVKRMIRYAAENGFDRVSYTTGEQQADRYSLRHQVDKIEWGPYKGGKLVQVWAKKGHQIRFVVSLDDGVVDESPHDYGRPFVGKRLDEVVGKTASEKIMAADSGGLEGEGLNIGGEGMVTFYNRIVPNVVNDVLKKLGGGRVGEVGIERQLARWEIHRGNGPDGDVLTYTDEKTARRDLRAMPGAQLVDRGATQPQPGFDITPEMREKVMGGVPMFARNDFRPAPNDRPLSASGPIDSLLAHAGGRWVAEHITRPVYDQVIELGRFVPEKVKAGVVADYGLDELYIDRRNEMRIRQREGSKVAKKSVEALAGLDRAQSRVAYQWMTQRDAEGDALLAQLPEAQQAVLRDLKHTITEMGREAVALGQLAPESFERNKMAYLHRTYGKFELEDTKQQKVARARAIKVMGDQYKGRGMIDTIDAAALESLPAKGEKFLRLEQRTDEGRLRRVVYVPAKKPVPEKYQAWKRDAEWEVRTPPKDRKGKVALWRDFTAEERQRMGELDEVKYATAKTLIMMTRDIEVGRLLRWVGEKYAKDSGDGLKVVETPTGNALSTFERDTWVQVPTTTVPGTAVKSYGDLAGKFIPAAMWNDIRQVSSRNFNPLGDIYGSLLRMWKVSKTALSPAVHMNNVMSNVILADMADVGGKDILRAAQVFARARLGKDAEAQSLLDRYDASGGELGAYALTELQKQTLEPLLEELRREIDRAEGEGSLVAAASTINLIFHGRIREAAAKMSESKASQLVGKGAKGMIWLYQQEDQAFRFAAWLKAVNEGKTDLQAGKVARESFLDYNINAPWIQNARATVFPFIAFAYRAVPMLLKAAAEKPWKLAKYAAVYGGLNALAYGMLGLGGDDEDRERKLLPEEKSGKLWGVFPRLMRMPWNDAHGAPVFLDIRRWIPVGDVLDFGQHNPAVPIPATLFPGGPLALFVEVLANKSLFTQKPITLETDTPLEVGAKFAKHLYQWISPNIALLPGTYAFDKVMQAGTGATDAFGREQSLPMAVASSLGIKVSAYPADVLEKNLAGKLARDTMELDIEFSRVKRKYERRSITDADFDAEIEKYTAKKAKLREAFEAKVGN